ncbi:sensor histidine kinase [Actinomadura alba]|uniref:histidine kinase n=1 Tax=Actinomadura alba TaxID=406431 RepID=A0ABR7M0F9_9ACTN|nr:HAMP domain-containing sensor histidine kinase [Actinomadura alba]MBC6470597.1 HAMP domain-containing histidine kinase [Actinomadura alba]
MLPLGRRSVRVRSTLVLAAMALMSTLAIGVILDTLIRTNAHDTALEETQRAAIQWIARARAGSAPHPIPTPGPVKLIQLVDNQGRVIDASAAADHMPPLSTIRPPDDDRIENVTVCRSAEGCGIVTAIRFALTDKPGDADPHYVYAGVEAPKLLASHELELFIGAGVIGLTALAAGINWRVSGRWLNAVESVRMQVSTLSMNNLGTRFGQPRQHELAMLTDTANQALDRLEKAVRQEQQFASEASHELRSPVAGLHTQLEEALLYPDDVDPRETIRTALSATDRLTQIINDLLVLARLRADPAPQETIDLGELVIQEATARSRDVPVTAHATSKVPVRGRPIQLIRVIGNLLDNAQRHANSRVEITAYRQDDLAVVAVTDDGPGIAPEDRERVFERFTRLPDGQRRDPGGSGLGLAISADIAHAHQGSLTVEDSPLGARFVLRLPLVESADGPAHPATDPVCSGERSSSGRPAQRRP